MAIDDRIGKALEILGPEDDGLLDGVLPDDLPKALASVGAVFSPIFAVASAVQSALDQKDQADRIRAAVRAICDELYAIRETLPANVSEALDSKWFRRAVRVVIDEAVRVDGEDRAVMLALIAVHGCFPEGLDKHRQQDLAVYIRDLAQLGTDDTLMLRMLCEAHRDAVRVAPNMNSPNAFDQGYGTLKALADKNGLHSDDCLAMGLRLAGFGLAHHTASGIHYQNEIRFRPTRRGLYLLELLTKAETSFKNRKVPHP